MKYCAFISYCRSDAADAKWLLRKLETYRVPRRLVGTQGARGPIQRRLGTFFRDREELAAGDDLGTVVRAALADSDALIVICSPAAARSSWVNAEVEAYQRLGGQEHILAFVVAGVPGVAPSPDNCFPRALIAADADGKIREPLAADARRNGDGRHRAFTKLVAGLLGVDYDMLARREAQRRIRRITAVAVFSLLGMFVALGLAVTAYVARNDAARRQAQAEDIMSFMVDDLRHKLTAVGRLDLMRAVDDKATSYYATLHARDLTEGVLEQQGRLLVGIGQERTKEGQQDAALNAFREAHERSQTLYDRDPANGHRLFDLAQTEYWIGWVAFQQARYDEAGVWLRRYRDSALRLAAMDRSNLDWQMEVAYGYQNLAILDEKLGRYASAQQAVERQLALYRRWIAERPHDLSLRYQAANAASWLGTLSLRLGALHDAEDDFTEMVEGLKLNVSAEPANTEWQDAIVQGFIFLADAQEQLGRRAQARASIDQANAIAGSLVAHDPANNEWRLTLATSVWRQAALARTPAEAAERLDTALHLLEAVQKVQPGSEYVTSHLAGVWNTRAKLALAHDSSSDAQDSAAKAVAAAQKLWDRVHSEEFRVLLAQSTLTAGDVAARYRDRESARAAWERARDLLEEAANRAEPLPFNRLECLVNSLYRLGDMDAAEPYRKRLEAAGFVPAEPFVRTAGL
jgi:tetratricopeptide (TPR) repeat protein